MDRAVWKGSCGWWAWSGHRKSFPQSGHCCLLPRQPAWPRLLTASKKVGTFLAVCRITRTTSRGWSGGDGRSCTPCPAQSPLAWVWASRGLRSNRCISVRPLELQRPGKGPASLSPCFPICARGELCSGSPGAVGSVQGGAHGVSYRRGLS